MNFRGGEFFDIIQYPSQFYLRFNYGRLVIYLGVLFSLLENAISYGDGNRESLCLKLTIPIFRRMGRTKYAQSMVRRVVILKSVLTEADAYEYRHNTTVGKYPSIANSRTLSQLYSKIIPLYSKNIPVSKTIYLSAKNV